MPHEKILELSAPWSQNKRLNLTSTIENDDEPRSLRLFIRSINEARVEIKMVGDNVDPTFLQALRHRLATQNEEHQEINNNNNNKEHENIINDSFALAAGTLGAIEMKEGEGRTSRVGSTFESCQDNLNSIKKRKPDLPTSIVLYRQVSWRKALIDAFDLVIVLLSIALIFANLASTVQFFMNTHYVPFYALTAVASLTSVIVAAVFAVFFREELLKEWNVLLIWMVSVPFASVLPLVAYFMHFDETKLFAGWIRSDSKTIKWICRHSLVILVAFIQSYPQTLFIVMAMIFYKQATAVQITAVTLSGITVLLRFAPLLVEKLKINIKIMMIVIFSVIFDLSSVLYSCVSILETQQQIHNQEQEENDSFNQNSTADFDQRTVYPLFVTDSYPHGMIQFGWAGYGWFIIGMTFAGVFILSAWMSLGFASIHRPLRYWCIVYFLLAPLAALAVPIALSLKVTLIVLLYADRYYHDIMAAKLAVVASALLKSASVRRNALEGELESNSISQLPRKTEIGRRSDATTTTTSTDNMNSPLNVQNRSRRETLESNRPQKENAEDQEELSWLTRFKKWVASNNKSHNNSKATLGGNSSRELGHKSSLSYRKFENGGEAHNDNNNNNQEQHDEEHHYYEQSPYTPCEEFWESVFMPKWIQFCGIIFIVGQIANVGITICHYAILTDSHRLEQHILFWTAMGSLLLIAIFSLFRCLEAYRICGGFFGDDMVTIEILLGGAGLFSKEQQKVAERTYRNENDDEQEKIKSQMYVWAAAARKSQNHYQSNGAFDCHDEYEVEELNDQNNGDDNAGVLLSSPSWNALGMPNHNNEGEERSATAFSANSSFGAKSLRSRWNLLAEQVLPQALVPKQKKSAEETLLELGGPQAMIYVKNVSFASNNNNNNNKANKSTRKKNSTNDTLNLPLLGSTPRPEDFPSSAAAMLRQATEDDEENNNNNNNNNTNNDFLRFPEETDADRRAAGFFVNSLLDEEIAITPLPRTSKGGKKLEMCRSFTAVQVSNGEPQSRIQCVGNGRFTEMSRVCLNPSKRSFSIKFTIESFCDDDMAVGLIGKEYTPDDLIDRQVWKLANSVAIVFRERMVAPAVFVKGVPLVVLPQWAGTALTKSVSIAVLNGFVHFEVNGMRLNCPGLAEWIVSGLFRVGVSLPKKGQAVVVEGIEDMSQKAEEEATAGNRENSTKKQDNNNKNNNNNDDDDDDNDEDQSEQKDKSSSPSPPKLLAAHQNAASEVETVDLAAAAAPSSYSPKDNKNRTDSQWTLIKEFSRDDKRFEETCQALISEDQKNLIVRQQEELERKKQSNYQLANSQGQNARRRAHTQQLGTSALAKILANNNNNKTNQQTESNGDDTTSSTKDDSAAMLQQGTYDFTVPKNTRPELQNNASLASALGASATGKGGLLNESNNNNSNTINNKTSTVLTSTQQQTQSRTQLLKRQGDSLNDGQLHVLQSIQQTLGPLGYCLYFSALLALLIVIVLVILYREATSPATVLYRVRDSVASGQDFTLWWDENNNMSSPSLRLKKNEEDDDETPPVSVLVNTQILSSLLESPPSNNNNNSNSDNLDGANVSSFQKRNVETGFLSIGTTISYSSLVDYNWRCDVEQDDLTGKTFAQVKADLLAAGFTSSFLQAAQAESSSSSPSKTNNTDINETTTQTSKPNSFVGNSNITADPTRYNNSLVNFCMRQFNHSLLGQPSIVCSNVVQEAWFASVCLAAHGRRPCIVSYLIDIACSAGFASLGKCPFDFTEDHGDRLCTSSSTVSRADTRFYAVIQGAARPLLTLGPNSQLVPVNDSNPNIELSVSSCTFNLEINVVFAPYSWLVVSPLLEIAIITITQLGLVRLVFIVLYKIAKMLQFCRRKLWGGCCYRGCCCGSCKTWGGNDQTPLVMQRMYSTMLFDQISIMSHRTEEREFYHGGFPVSLFGWSFGDHTRRSHCYRVIQSRRICVPTRRGCEWRIASYTLRRFDLDDPYQYEDIYLASNDLLVKLMDVPLILCCLRVASFALNIVLACANTLPLWTSGERYHAYNTLVVHLINSAVFAGLLFCFFPVTPDSNGSFFLSPLLGAIEECPADCAVCHNKRKIARDESKILLHADALALADEVHHFQMSKKQRFLFVSARFLFMGVVLPIGVSHIVVGSVLFPLTLVGVAVAAAVFTFVAKQVRSHVTMVVLLFLVRLLVSVVLTAAFQSSTNYAALLWLHEGFGASTSSSTSTQQQNPQNIGIAGGGNYFFIVEQEFKSRSVMCYIEIIRTNVKTVANAVNMMQVYYFFFGS